MAYPYYQYQPMQMPTFQPQFQPQMGQLGGLSGRIVESFESINASDVPIDGKIAVFPRSDLSEIEIRSWGSDGLIKRISYSPKLDDFNAKASISTPSTQKCLEGGKNDVTDALEVISKRLDSIEKALKVKKEVKNGCKTDGDADAQQ